VRVVFLGTPPTAVPSLEAILAAGHDVPLVVTRPDRPSGRSGALQPSAVKRAAAGRGLAVLQPESLRGPETAAAIARERADVLAIVAYGRKLPAAMLRSAPLGAVNLHFSLLPAYRGAAPVAWALARGETSTGVSTFLLDEGLDTGDLLEQVRLPIEPAEHAPALLARLAGVGAPALVRTLDALASGTARATPQDHGRATTAPLLRRDDGAFDAAWSARDLEGRVRGFDPWPGVWAQRQGSRLRITSARALDGTVITSAPGTVLAEGERICVACASGTVAEILAVQPEGRRAVSAREARNGRQLLPGDRLEPPRPAA